MLKDRLSELSRDQAITADAISSNVRYLGPMGGNATIDIAAGEPLFLHVLVKTTLTDADGTPTLTVTLESDDVAALNSAPVVHMTKSAVTEATLVAGYWIFKGEPLPAGSYKPYLGIRYTTNVADFDGGTVDAWISNNRFDDRTYESGYSSGVN